MFEYKIGYPCCFFENKTSVQVRLNPNDIYQKRLRDFLNEVCKYHADAEIHIADDFHIPAVSKVKPNLFQFKIENRKDSIDLCYMLGNSLAEDMGIKILGNVEVDPGASIANRVTGDRIPITDEDLSYVAKCRISMCRNHILSLASILSRRIAKHFRNSSLLDMSSFILFACKDIIDDFEDIHRLDNGNSSSLIVKAITARISPDNKLLKDIFFHLRSLKSDEYYEFCDTNEDVLHIWFNSDKTLMFGRQGFIGSEACIARTCLSEPYGMNFFPDLLEGDCNMLAYILSACEPSNVVIYNIPNFEEYIRQNNAFFDIQNVFVVSDDAPDWYDDKTNYLDSGIVKAFCELLILYSDSFLHIPIHDFIGDFPKYSILLDEIEDMYAQNDWEEE